jgi:formylglycine-generating enzyme required for sulfatase activity/tRNA A-37 threonylcarbamoyl transferase component Bud32
MKTLDLCQTIPSTIALLEDQGEPASVSAVLQTLGVQLAPTLRPSDAGKPLRAPEGELLSLGRFQLTAELGSGGMGRVLEARDPELRRLVAIKVVIDPKKVTEAQLARFLAEAQITSQLEHPNIVPVHEMGLAARGDLYFVMKKVEGRSLKQVLAALRDGDEATTAEWTRTKLLQAFIQVCNAVAYAHDRGVLHRDLKPDNVMLGPFGEVLLMDWGVARLMGDTSELVSSESIERVTMAHTMDGAAIGTPGYMSPEQAQGNLHELDGRSDVWSLGAVLYEVLTLRRAYEAPNVYALMFAAMSGPPESPRARAPERGIPEEVAEVCLRAMAPGRQDRYATATELAAAVQAHLDGSKRREAAMRHLASAEAAWERYLALAGEREELLAREKELDEVLEPWAPLEEKAELLAVRRRLGTMQPRRVRLFGEVLTACDQAFSQDPGSPLARNLLAKVHYARFEEAEAQRDEEDRLYHEDRVRTFDDGRYAALLKGTGALTLYTDPPGAEVVCERYDTSADLAWPLVERRVLGRTPLLSVPLEQGSYLLTVRSPGKRDTRYPVFIPRGRHWDSGEAPVPLYAAAALPEGLVYVPPGPFVCGGDAEAQDALPRSEPWVPGFLMSVFPVTMQEYAGFLSALARQDRDEAWSRVPRQESGLKEGGGQYWDRPAPGEPYSVPEVDRDGDRWDPRWPVFAVSWEDAQAYVAWRSARDGVAWTLPTEQQWEKAARGADGRLFPWGDGFEPNLCKMRASRPGRPQPEPVGALAADSSPYGVRDMAGGMRDWCGDATYGGDPGRRPVRGGSWHSSARSCRCANRIGLVPWSVDTSYGFRLALAAAPSGPQDSG